MKSIKLPSMPTRKESRSSIVGKPLSIKITCNGRDDLHIKCAEYHKWQMREEEKRKYNLLLIECFPFGRNEDIRG